MRIFITHIAPPDKAQNLGISIAATNFSYNLAEDGTFDKIYSVLPPFIRNIDSEAISDNIITIPVSWLRKTPLSRFGAIFEQIKIFKSIPNNSNVWFYNLSALNALLIRLLKIFKPSVKIFVIILDYTPGERKAEKWLPLINNCDGRIMLSNSQIFNKNNASILPGVVPLSNKKWPLIDKVSMDFLISGQLSENISMLSTLLDIFSKNPKARLHITGNLNKETKDFASKFSNIICYGVLSYDDFLSVMHSCPFLLSTRNPDMPENQCNFPSKILEGLLHNRIIISTIEYPQLKDIKYLKIEAAQLSNSISQIVNMSDDGLLPFANQANKVIRLFNTDVWKNTMTLIEQKAR